MNEWLCKTGVNLARQQELCETFLQSFLSLQQLAIFTADFGVIWLLFQGELVLQLCFGFSSGKDELSC
jgi:hypothetical protein